MDDFSPNSWKEFVLYDFLQKRWPRNDLEVVIDMKKYRPFTTWSGALIITYRRIVRFLGRVPAAIRVLKGEQP